jgi:uncharacterized protein YlaI
MSGTNGLTPVANLSERQKCPTHPSKRRYHTSEEADVAARKRARETRLPIEAYLCPDCGSYHLTKTNGGTNLRLQNGKLTVGEFKSLAPTHPVFSGTPEPEEPDPSTLPLVPVGHDARVRVARRWLAERPEHEPSTSEVSEVLGGATREAVRNVMRDLGYRNTNGRSARWVKDEPAPEPERPQAAPEATNDAAPDERVWRDLLTAPIEHMTVGDLIAAYAAYGVTLRIQGSDG